MSQLDSGQKNLRDLALELGITHQRVSQIYYKATNKPSKSLSEAKRQRDDQARQAQMDAYLKEVKLNCKECGKPVSRQDGRHLLKYCRDCHIKSQDQKLALNVTLQCMVCEKDYHPKRNFRSAAKRKTINRGKYGNFCSLECYWKRRKAQ